MHQNHARPALSRRVALQGGAALLAAGAVTVPAASQAADVAPTDVTPLKDLAAAKGMRFGSAVGVLKGGFNDPRTPELLARECNIIVPENELKMYTTHNTADGYNFAPGDLLLKFAQDNKMAMRGHNLFWARDEFTPQWLKAYDFGATPKGDGRKTAARLHCHGHRSLWRQPDLVGRHQRDHRPANG